MRDRFHRGTQFLKSNRISLTDGLTSNKDEDFINKTFFPCYIEEYVDFVPFSGDLVGMAAFCLHGSAFEGHGSPPPG